MKIHIVHIFFSMLFLVFSKPVFTQPKPGDYFKEYIWTTPDAEGNSSFFRVGGKVGYRTTPQNYPDLEFIGDQVQLKKDVDLNDAVKSEVTVEKVLCHDGTKNLRISVNKNKYVVFPESAHIPDPQEFYMHHFYPTVQIPLSDLKTGLSNYFSIEVDTAHHWNWPQNLIYGVIFRVYCPVPKSFPESQIKAKQIDEEKIEVSLETENEDDIESVDFIAKYDGPDMDGDGKYIDWHYHYFRGNMKNHLGSSDKSPFKINWDISWLPNQDKPVSISARVNYKSGFIYFAKPFDLEITRESYSVEFCKPANQPQRWLTRAGENSEEVFIKTNPKDIFAAKMIFTTWSPGYFNGIYINDFLEFEREGPKYAFMQHDIPIGYLDALEKGKNIIRTGKTPRHHGEMVHGVEIMWPGIMLLVKSGDPKVLISEVMYKNTPHFKVITANATWYIEKQSGGCSSLIDVEGRDWIDFKKTGTTGPNNSADSDYRGLPNMVYRDPGNGVGHPGFNQCKTKKFSENELLVQSKDKKWQFRWIFYPNYAEIVIEKADTSRKYWFLYEGPVGGEFNPKTHYWGNNSDGLRTDEPSLFGSPAAGNWQWVFFGDHNTNTTLFVAMEELDNYPEYFAYMGNSPNKKNLSEDGMNVFGFGRGLNAKPMLSGQNRFFVGFFPENSNNDESVNHLEKYINAIINNHE